MATILEEQKEQQGAPEAQEHPIETPAQRAAHGTQSTAPEPGRRAPRADEEPPLTREQVLRAAAGALMTTLGASFLVGGMFVGWTPRLYAAVGGIVGVVMAVWAARAQKRPTLIQILSLLGILVAGMIMLGITNTGALGRLGSVVGEAASNARLRRPPAPFDLGWRAILPWTIGMVGYAAAWVGSVGRKPAVGVLLPIPVIAFAAIAQPSEAQAAAGIVAFLTFAIGLAIIYRADRGEGEGVSTAYELKRAAKTAPLVIVITVALIGASQAGFLFPDPLYDPTEKAQLPRSVPLSAAQDRVLFSCKGEFTGPWRTGVLDVYDGENWRMPAYNQQSFVDVPRSGLLGEVFNHVVPNTLRSDCTVGGLEGTVLPLPARMFGISAVGPALVADPRTQSVRVKEGQVRAGLSYTPVYAPLPTEEDLRQAAPVADPSLLEFTDTGNKPPPPAVQSLLDEARSQTENTWDYLDFVRKRLLDTVTVTGQGLPVSVPPEKVQDMLDGTKEGTPYEIIAGQVLLARWAGVPARMGYGFDGGNKTGETIEYRPVHGSSWLEVYFNGAGWFPVTGLPKKAKVTVGSDTVTLDANILPSDDIQVNLMLPLRVQPSDLLFKQLQKLLLLLTPFVILFALTNLLWPYFYKLRRRSKRRQWAMQQGRSERIAVAYADLRDMATDLGVGDPYATPLAYVQKVVPDEEHLELAWLVTRCLWGDLRENITDDEVLAAEELVRSLRRRMFEAQPFTIRGIALVSRLSLRDPYAPELLSPPVPKFELRRALAALNPKRVLQRIRARKSTREEILDEAIDVA